MLQVPQGHETTPQVPKQWQAVGPETTKAAGFQVGSPLSGPWGHESQQVLGTGR